MIPPNVFPLLIETTSRHHVSHAPQVMILLYIVLLHVVIIVLGPILLELLSDIYFPGLVYSVKRWREKDYSGHKIENDNDYKPTQMDLLIYSIVLFSPLASVILFWVWMI